MRWSSNCPRPIGRCSQKPRKTANTRRGGVLTAVNDSPSGFTNIPEAAEKPDGGEAGLSPPSTFTGQPMPWNIWNTSLNRWENLTSFPKRSVAAGFLAEVVIPDGREGGPFEVRRTGSVLEEHGTKLMALKPSMVWQCAMDDLGRREHNATVGDGGVGEYKQYAFHRRHVLKASTANDILRAAIEEPGLGRASGKRDTRLLYSDVDLLRAALQ